MSHSTAANGAGGPAPAGLILDWGGVLTAPLDDSMRAWAQRDEVDLEHFREVMAGWWEQVADVAGGADGAGPGARDVAAVAVAVERAPEVMAALEQAPEVVVRGATDRQALQTPVHRLERGEITPAQFEQALAGELALRGSKVAADGLLDRMLGDLAELSDDMLGLIARARRAGLRTALLSNSWGEHYPDALFQGLFDAVVISGRVGMRKPEERIFRYTADALGLAPGQCVMVDDLPVNVHAAAAAGMIGVQHRSYRETADELEILFGIPLR